MYGCHMFSNFQEPSFASFFFEFELSTWKSLYNTLLLAIFLEVVKKHSRENKSEF